MARNLIIYILMSRKKHKPRSANIAFTFVVSQANRKDLSYLLEICAGVSVVAGLAEARKDPLRAILHHQTSRILLDAILESNASVEHTARPRANDLAKLINNTKDAGDDPEAIQRMMSASGTHSARLELMRFLAQLGQIQIAPFEHHPTVVAGRAVAFLDEIPATLRPEIEARVAGARRILDLPIKRVLGITARQAADVYMLLLKHYSSLWHEVSSQLSQGERRVAEILPQLDHCAAQGYWSFTPRSLTGGSGLLEAEIEAFLGLFARSPEELRMLSRAQGTPFGVGPYACRMLPVDRFPIVALPGNQYAIPNITILRNSFARVLDFSLLDAYRNFGIDELYNQVRGASLELYLQALIADRLPSSILIPETPYRTSHGEKKSPDLCVLDVENKWLIAIEAKARRLSPVASVTATDSDLDNNHAPSIQALSKLPSKIGELRKFPEFEQWRSQLAQIPADRTILVSVVAEALFFHDELEPLRARFDSHHPLAELELPFCFLDLPVFENAVEVARAHQVPLGLLLQEHYEDTRTGDPNTSAGRRFRGREEPDPSDRYAWRFL